MSDVKIAKKEKESYYVKKTITINSNLRWRLAIYTRVHVYTQLGAPHTSLNISFPKCLTGGGRDAKRRRHSSIPHDDAQLLFLELCAMMNIVLLQVDSIWSARTHFRRHTCGARTAFINETSFPSAIKTLWSTSVMLQLHTSCSALRSSILYVMKGVPWVTVQMSVSGAPRSYSPLVFLNSTPLASVMTGLETGAVDIKHSWNVNDRLRYSKINLLMTARWIRYWRVGDFLKSTRHL